jgi:hypothetical protein
MLTASFVSNIYLNSKRNIKFVDRYFEVYRAHDFVVSFLQQAPNKKKFWKKLDKSSFVFAQEKNINNNSSSINNNSWDIGFYVDNKNRLLKKTGKYNLQNNSWSGENISDHAGYSILLNNCNLEFIPVSDASSGNIIGADLILRDKDNVNLYCKRFVKFCSVNNL